MAALKKPLKIERPTQEQLATFMTFCEHHYQVLCDKSFQNTAFAKRCWEELAEILNEMDGPKKTAVRWRETLSSWKKSMNLRMTKKKKEVPKPSPKIDHFVDVDLSTGDCKDSSVTTLTAKKPYSYMAKLGSSVKTFPTEDKFELKTMATEPKSFVKRNTVNAVSKNLNAPQPVETKIKKSLQPAHNRWRKVYSDYIYCELERYTDADAQRLKSKLTSVCLNFMPQDDYSGHSSQIL